MGASVLGTLRALARQSRALWCGVLLAAVGSTPASGQGIPDAGYDFILLSQAGLGAIGGEDLANDGFIAGRVGEAACAFGFCAYVGQIGGPGGPSPVGLVLPFPAGHEARAEAHGVNVVGWATGYLDNGGTAFRWNGKTIPLPGLGVASARGVAINDLGVIGGWAADPAYNGESHAVIWTLGNEIVRLEDFGGMYSRVRDLNNLGETCGEALTTDGVEHAFFHAGGGGSMVDLGTLGGFESGAQALNATGTVVGRSLNAALSYIPFVWDATLGMRPLPLPPGTARGTALDINNAGLIVGDAGPPIIINNSVATIWDTRGEFVHNLNALRAPNTTEVTALSAIAINDAGWILARATATDGVLLRPRTCYPDCTGDGALTIADFGCFQTQFVMSERYADCNKDGSRTVADFACFQSRFAGGCP